MVHAYLNFFHFLTNIDEFGQDFFQYAKKKSQNHFIRGGGCDNTASEFGF